LGDAIHQAAADGGSRFDIGVAGHYGDPLPASFMVPIVREERKTTLVASYGGTKVAQFAADRSGKRKRG